MVTIYLNSENAGLTFESFKTRMIQICNEHRNQNRALAFAFILYDFDNAQLHKILMDNAYWLALNKICGRYLTVFSLHFKEPVKPIIRPNRRTSGMEFMLEVPTSISPSEGTNELIKNYFGRDFRVTYPAVLFFQVDQNEVVDSLLVSLKQESIEPAFNELKQCIQTAVDALQRITPENKQNIRQIFDCLEREIESAKTIKTIKRVFKTAGRIIEIIENAKKIL